MKINQIITENYNGEYDDEAGMAQTNLHTIARAAQGLLDTIDDKENLPEWVQEKIAKVEGMMVTAWDYLLSQEEQGTDPRMMEAKSAHPQQAATAIAMKKAGKKPKNESTELEEEFDLIESIIERLAAHNGVDAEVIWEDLETLTEDELYAFAVTSEPIMESTRKGEYGRVLDALGLYYPRISMEELNTPGYYKVIANKADVPVEYAAQVIDGFANDDRYYDNEDDEEQGMAERSLNEVTQGVEHSEWVDNVRDAYPGVKIIKKRTEDGRHIKSQAILNGQLVGQYNMNTGVGTFKAPKQQGVAEDWQKANKRDKTDGMSQKAVNAYRRENPGSKLKTAVTTKPSKLKKGGKASKRRKSYCSRSRGQMKMHSISCAKTPDKAICKARRRWNC